MSNVDYNDADWSPRDAKPLPPPAAKSTPEKQPVGPKTDEYGRPIAEKLPAATKTEKGTGITLFPRPAQTPGDYGDEDWTPSSAKKEETPAREISRGEAATRGYVDLATYGLAPAIAGLSAAGTAPGGTGIPAAMEGVASESPGGEAVGEGVARLWNDHFGNHPDPAARQAYEQGAQSVLGNDQMAWDQHKAHYMAGQFGAALTMPGSVVGGLIRKGMTGLATKILGGGLATGAGNALYQSGHAISEGRPEDIPEEAGKGFVTGSVLGTGGRIGSEALGGVAGKIANRVGGLVRGAISPDWEAGHKVVSALRGDIHAPIPDVGIGPSEVPAARASTAPVITADFGGKETAALAKNVAKSSPEAGQAIRDVVNPRHEEQAPRIGNFVRSLAGAKNYTAEADRIAADKLAFNKPAYQKAYAAGDRPIWNNPKPRPGVAPNELEILAGSDAVKNAIGGAVKRGKDKAIADDIGMGAFRPSISVDSQGGIQFTKGPTGVPTYPNIQFWDYVQREMKDDINNLYDKGSKDQAGTIVKLRNRLLAELDHQVPEFAQARQTAANFFNAENALEAGKEFVTSKEKDLTESRRAFAALKPEEQRIFQRSFASELATQIEAIPPNADLTAKSKVLDSAFLRDGLPRKKIEMVLGPQKTNELEAQLRFEEGIDRVRRVVQEPNWIKEMAKSAGGHAGLASAVGGVEYLREGEFDPKAIVGIGLGFGLYRKAAGKIDAKVALRIGQMLTSDDPALFQKAAQMAAASEPIMNALRSFTAAGTRVGAADTNLTSLGATGLLALQKVWGLRGGHEPEHQPHEPSDREPQSDQ